MALKRSRLRDAAKTSTLTGAGKEPTATSSDDRGSEISGESRCTRGGNKEQVSRQRSLKMRPGRGRPATELGRGGAAACAARGVPRQEPLPAKMPARCRKDRHGPRLPVRAGGSLRRGRAAAGQARPPGAAGHRKRLPTRQTSPLRSAPCHSHPAFGDRRPARPPSRRGHRGRPATSKKTTTRSRLGRRLAFFTNTVFFH